MQHHVFISYSEADEQSAARLTAHLRAAGLTVWAGDMRAAGLLHQRDLYEQAVREAGCVVAVFSPTARHSRWVREQTEYARKIDTPLVGVLVGGIKGDSTPPLLNQVAWVDASADFDAGGRELAAAVQGILQLEGPFKQPLRVWNPLDLAMFLGWVFFAPGRYLAYRAFAGHAATQRAAAWLSAWLIWLPLFLATGCSVIVTARRDTALVFGLLLAGMWLLSAYTGARRDDGLGALLGVGAFFFSMALTFALTDRGMLVGLSLVTAGVISAVVVQVIAGEVARALAMGVALGTAVGMVTLQMNVIDGGVWIALAFAAALGLVYLLVTQLSHYLREMVRLRRSPIQMRALFGIWVLALALVMLAYLAG